MAAVVKFVEKVVQTVGYFFTGTYEGTEGNDRVTATSLTLGWGRGILVKGGDDEVYAAASILELVDTTGNLQVYGASGYTLLHKEGAGDLKYYGASGKLKVRHTGFTGNVDLYTVAADSTVLREGYEGNLTVGSVNVRGTYHLKTQKGNLTFNGGAAYLTLLREGPVENSSGNMTINGVGAWVNASSDVRYGDLTGYTLAGNGTFKRSGHNSNVDLKLAGISNHVAHSSTFGNTKVHALGGKNYIHRKGLMELLLLLCFPVLELISLPTWEMEPVGH